MAARQTTAALLLAQSAAAVELPCPTLVVAGQALSNLLKAEVAASHERSNRALAAVQWQRHF